MIDRRNPDVYTMDIRRREGMQATISKWGNSQGIRLSKETLESAGMKVDDILSVETRDNEIVLKKAAPKKRMSLKERFEGYDGPPPETYDWGKPMGKEMW